MYTEIPIILKENYSIKDKKACLITVDVINGFCKPGCGNLAPLEKDLVIEEMIKNIDQLSIGFSKRQLPIISLIDCHEAGVLEPPYPLHCEEGTDEPKLVDELMWLNDYLEHNSIYKNCINGYISNYQLVKHLIRLGKIDTLIVVGICTDICVMQFVQAVLSARNSGELKIEDVVVVTPACATYDLPDVHPRDLTHHMGLYLMQQSGAILTDGLTY